jgi:hypothetical protein
LAKEKIFQTVLVKITHPFIATFSGGLAPMPEESGIVPIMVMVK